MESNNLYDILNECSIFSKGNTQENEYSRFLIIFKRIVDKKYKIVEDKENKHITIKDNNDFFEVGFYSKYAIVTIVSHSNTERFFVIYDERCKIVNLYKKFINRNKKNLIMIGGSFNPITLAHYEMAKAMVENIEESYVVFVPTCDYYIKSFKKYTNDSILRDKHRYQLLTETTLFDSNILIDDVEMLEKREKTKTFQTLFKINEIYKPQNICFSICSDNIKHMSRWWCVEGLLSMATCIVISRDIVDIADEINEYEFLRNKANCFRHLSYENEYPTLSSTFGRELMTNGDCDEVKKYIPIRAYHSLMGIVENAQKKKYNNDDLIKSFMNNIERNG